ncbi:MAG: lamin tail domain-containing protein [Ignavibacterium sp.]|nr:lamin tail domain-containing protein [Ignavibacterium sp.]
MIKKLLIIVFLFSAFIFSQADTSLILTEIIFIPQSGNNEFIEIYNLSENDTIDLAGYKFKYHTSNPDIFTDAGFGTLLLPQSYAVVFEGDYDINTGIYSGLVPPSALILKISDNAFGTSGMANTEARSVWLLNTNNDTLDVYTYSANNATGRSDEKIVLNKDSSQTNWANSIVPNGSPGFRNSVALYEFDLQIFTLTFSPAIVIQGDDLTIIAKVKNRGSDTANNYSIEIFNDINFDSAGTANELIFSQSLSNLLPGDSVEVQTILSSLSDGDYQIIAQVLFNEDENPVNNKIINNFTVYPPGNEYNDIVVNEIMYAPSTGEPEWIELYNRTDQAVNIKKWRFSDAANTATITTDDIFIQSKDYIVLTQDSSILNLYNVPVQIVRFNLPILNNTGDNVVLRDSLGILIDSLTYLSSWGGNTGGRSLERYSADSISTNQNNWATSTGLLKATPGRINSISPKENDLTIIGFTPQQQYSILGEDIEFTVQIKNKGLINSQNFTLNLYRDINTDSIPQPNELMTSIAQNAITTGDSIEINYSTNLFNEGNNFYIAVIDVPVDDDSSNNIAFTKVIGVEVNEIRNDLVINEFMYAPLSPEPEWIEIYNRSDKIIDLKNYKIADNRDTISVITESVILNPGEYHIIATDSSINNFYNITSGISYRNFPALNNTGDKVILLDSLNRTIDSLEFYSTWGGTGGKSLERIDAELSSIDSSNWKTSLSKYKATPGYINSVTQKDFNLFVTEIIFDPEFPLKGDDVQVKAFIKNAGRNSATFNIQLFEDINLDSIPDQQIRQLNQLNIQAGDSIEIDFTFTVPDLQIKKAFYVIALFGADQDTSNNYIYNTIEPGVPSQSIVINEIMFTPQGGEPEWVELFNRSDEIINLKDWVVSDVLTTPVSAKINVDLIIEPNSFVVLTKDSTIFNYHRFIPSQVYKLNLPVLNNDVDGVVIKDQRGLTIDSVLYNSQWGGTNGYSLERVSVDGLTNQSGNWASSIDIEQSTPGRINSITPKQFDLRVAGMRFEPRFPVAGDDVFIIADIKNSGSSSADNFTVEFYIDTDSNNVVDLLLNSANFTNLASEDSLSVTSSFPISNLQANTLAAVRVVFFPDEDTLNNYFERSVQPGEAERIIVVNEVMYNPDGGEPEWIEFVNISDMSINISNWSISDVLTTPTKNIITIEETLIEPGEYFIVSRDSSIFNYHPELDVKIFYTNFGTLGNTADGVVIYDYRDGIIDSLFYRSGWGGRRGYSLERISSAGETKDSINWSTSLGLNGSTPGKENSFAGVPAYQRNTLIINEIMFDPESGESEYVEFINLSNDSVNVGGWKIEDQNSNFYRLSDISYTIPAGSYFVLASDSGIFNRYTISTNSFISVVGASNLGLVNTGELILLKDVKSNVVDSVWYQSNWHNRNITNTKGKSLERINPTLNGNDPSNWSTTVDPFGGTPGKVNSIFAQNLNQEKNISVSPNPFSPDNDGFEDFTIINYNLTQPIAQVRIKIFDNKGRLLRTLLNNAPSGQSGSVIFDGLDDDGQVLRIGIYIIFLEAMNDNAGVVETMKTVVVVARKL